MITWQENLRDLLKTSQTYKTRAGALAKLEKELSGIDFNIHYLIATTPEGRFAPVVINQAGHQLLSLCHNGVTVIG
tara:strand:+ start:426 stop:653 length:228 start_codon:yes stop_codon:yes gene_type:complete